MVSTRSVTDSDASPFIPTPPRRQPTLVAVDRRWSSLTGAGASSSCESPLRMPIAWTAATVGTWMTPATRALTAHRRAFRPGDVEWPLPGQGYPPNRLAREGADRTGRADHVAAARGRCGRGPGVPGSVAAVSRPTSRSATAAIGESSSSRRMLLTRVLVPRERRRSAPPRSGSTTIAACARTPASVQTSSPMRGSSPPVKIWTPPLRRSSSRWLKTVRPGRLRS